MYHFSQAQIPKWYTFHEMITYEIPTKEMPKIKPKKHPYLKYAKEEKIQYTLFVQALRYCLLNGSSALIELGLP